VAEWREQVFLRRGEDPQVDDLRGGFAWPARIPCAGVAQERPLSFRVPSDMSEMSSQPPVVWSTTFTR
jgi:hypothetical protein